MTEFVMVPRKELELLVKQDNSIATAIAVRNWAYRHLAASPQPVVGDREMFGLLRELIQEQSEGEWDDDMIDRDARKFTDAILASLASRPEGDRGETWASMAAWTEETFGEVTLERIATRANEEMQELLADPSDVMEAADVCIVLSRYPGIADAINRKMAINRGRKWRLNGDGSGYHIPPPPSGEGG